MNPTTTLLVKQHVVDLNDVVKRARLLRRIYDVVAVSFVEYPMRHRTTAEEKRRTELCYSAFKILRNDHHYSYERSLDNIGRCLNHVLDTSEFKKSNRASWAAKEET